MTLRRTSGLVLALAVLVIGVPNLAEAAPEDDPSRPYIVVVRRGHSGEHVANEHAEARRAKVSHKYRTVLNGYAATIPDSEIDRVRRDPRVAFVEPDLESVPGAQAVPWGISRIHATSSSQVSGDGSGAVANVQLYVLDSGVGPHGDLNIRHHQNFVGDNKNFDCNGHGTHVAGTAAAADNTSAVVGVAPGAPITGVKIFGCTGGAPNSRVIAGVEWITNDWLARKPTLAGHAAVANGSLSGKAADSLDAAFQNSAAAGITWAVAAGNSSTDACKYSPARAGQGTNGIITVGALNKRDGMATFSNRGSCVDMWAPGVGILSTWKGGETETLRGTSMATPHVAGTAALFVSANPTATASQVEADLKARSDPVPNKPFSIVDAGEY